MAIARGEIYFVNLSPVQGRQQAGSRPVLVLSADAINQLPLVITVVVGTKVANVSRDYPTNVRVPSVESGLPMETVFLCFQLRSLDRARFPAAAAARLSDAYLALAEDASAIVWVCDTDGDTGWSPIFPFFSEPLCS